MLASGVWNPKPQTELKSSEYGRRMPEDGVIIWGEPAVAIDRLVKASTTPHPRAFTFLGNAFLEPTQQVELYLQAGKEDRITLVRAYKDGFPVDYLNL